MAAPNSIKTKLISLAAVMLICAQAVFATVQTVAVLPSEGVLDINDLEFLTNKAQEIAVRVLPRNTFEVFPRDVIIRRLGGVENYLKECREAACIVDLGKKAQVDYVSQCSFGKFGSDFTVTFELYKVSTSALVDKFSEYAKDIYSLLAIMEKRIPEGFLKIPGASPETKTAPPEPTPPPPAPPPKPAPELFVVPVEPVAAPAYDEPYTPSVAYESESGGGEDEEDDDGRKVFSLGLRIGFNFSHLYAEYNYGSGEASYNSTPGFQLGMVFDWALTDWFHIQPGVMYIQKGTEDNYGNAMSFHYIETPLLLSLKFSAFRLNAGPYFAGCLSGSCEGDDIGLSTGLGFDIGMFYIGAFYDFGLGESWMQYNGISGYNRTLGFNFGVNL